MKAASPRERSRRAASASRPLALALTAAALGCLPAGKPPPGRQVIHDRTLGSVYLSPSERDGVPSYLLASGPTRNPPLDGPLAYQTLDDLYVFADPGTAATTEGLAGMQPAIEGMQVPSVPFTSSTLPTDALGRLLYVRFSPLTAVSQPSPFEVRRFDPTSNTEERIASADLLSGQVPFIRSLGRTRGYAPNSGEGKLFELEGEHLLWSVLDAVFVGEDFYCTGLLSAPDPTSAAPGSNVIRIKPNAEPEVLLSSTGQLGITPIVGDQAPQLLLSLVSDQGRSAFSLLDTGSLVSTPLPAQKGQAQFVSASPDGHWLAFVSASSSTDPTQPPDNRYFVYNWVDNIYTSLDSSVVGQNIGGYSEWRPGHQELWISLLPDGLAVWLPGSYLATARNHRIFHNPRYWPSAFTQDGAHWFSNDAGDSLAVTMGSSDDPTGTTQQLNPAGTGISSPSETRDGRLLVQIYLLDPRRSDISLVDPGAGTTQAIASNGHVVTLGQTRALALLNFDLARLAGDLTLVDLASGRPTLLAEDVYSVAVDRGMSATLSPETDILAPGTRIAFLTRNRLHSPYDGLWVGELP